ncbi:hypothetical protein [Nocardioides sp.]|uniref:hypothetical protein n=1 Tax=Nocardioides sp. TaxID=35761 RepID=UPI00352701A1
MSTWLRVRHVPTLCLVALLCLLLAGAVGGRQLLLPVVVGNEGRAVWSTFLPLVWAMAVCDAFATTGQGVEARPGRRLRSADSLLFAGCCTIGVVVFLPGAGSVPPLATAGHVLTLTGLAGLVTLWRGAGAGALATTSLLIVTTLYGVQAPLGRLVRVLQPDGSTAAAWVVGTALCAGTVLTLLRHRRGSGPEA